MAQDFDDLKRAAAESAVSQVTSGTIVGLGTGSTAAFAIEALGKRVQEGLKIIGVATSRHSEAQAKALGIAVGTLNDYPQIDLTIDGADEVERNTLNLIKGYGGALLREKIVASASKRLIIIADETKLVDRLGKKHAVPVEVDPFGWRMVALKIEALGSKPQLRVDSEGKAFITDGGHYILNCFFGLIENPAGLAQKLDRIVGVVDHGLFINMASEVHLADSSGVIKLFPTRGEFA